MNKKTKGIIAALGLSVMLTGATVMASSYTFTSYEDLSVDDSTTSNNSSTKTSTDDEFEVKVKDKTMWSNPSAKLVNSEGKSRSDSVKLSGTSTYTGSGNDGEVGYYYWLKVTSAWNQVGTDSINLKFSAH